MTIRSYKKQIHKRYYKLYYKNTRRIRDVYGTHNTIIALLSLCDRERGMNFGSHPWDFRPIPSFLFCQHFQFFL